MRKLGKILLRALPFLLVAAFVCSVLFYPEAVRAEEKIFVVRIWNVDTFEGGTGSRTAFLKKVARSIEKTNGSLYFLVTDYTAEGARTALERGEKPDVLSFGIGLPDFCDYMLPFGREFVGGAYEGKTLAYPWCAGRYSLFSLTDDFEEEGRTAISRGGCNLPAVSACLNGVDGEILPSTEAYIGFLNGKYRYLLGTQRDERRFHARGVEVLRKELPNFCDLYQYIAILSAEKMTACRRFTDALLSDAFQSRLSEIGMFSLAESGAEQTVSVFLSEEERTNLSECDCSDIAVKNLDKFLKSI